MGYIHCAADFTSDCAICGQSVVPGNVIALLQRGYGRNPGVSAHEGCWDWPEWRDQQNQNPCLTAGQVDALLNAMVGHRMPDDDVRVQRFLGALRRAKNRQTFIRVHTIPEIRLIMGSDLYAGYQTVLRILDQDRIIGEFWRPVHVSGRPWTEPRTVPAPAPPAPNQAPARTGVGLPQRPPFRPVVPLRAHSPQQAEAIAYRDNILELGASEGYWVRGRSITPVMVGSTAGGMIWIRTSQPKGPWQQVHPRQVHLTLAEAQADAKQFCGIAAGGR